MTPEQIQELIDMLITIGGTAATSAFSFALKKIMVSGVLSAFGTLIAFVMTIWAQVKMADIKNKEEDKENKNFIRFISVMLLILGVFCTWATLQHTLSYLIAPEWEAIQLILNTIGG